MKISIYKKILIGFIIVSIIPLIIGIFLLSSYFKTERTKELLNILNTKLTFRKNSFIEIIHHEERDIKNLISISKISKNKEYLNNLLKLIIFKSKLIKEIDIIDKNGKLIKGESYIDFKIPGQKTNIPSSKYSIEFLHNLYFLTIKTDFYDNILLLKISLKDVFENMFQERKSIFKYFIADKDGRLIFHSNYAYVLLKNKINVNKLNNILEHSLISPCNKKTIYYISVISKIKDFNLFFGVSIEKKIAYKQIYSLLTKGSFVIFIICILSIIISLILSRALANPINNLVRITKNIKKGIFNIKFPKKYPNDEIGELYINFELMVKTVTNLIKEKQLKINKLNALFNTINDSIYVINSNYEIVLININELAYLNKELSEVIGKKCYEVFANRNTICPFCGIEKVKINKNPIFYNNINLVEKEFRKECKRKYVNMAFYPFEEDEFLIYIKDLTQIYNILNQIELEREKLYVTLHAIGDGVIVVNKNKKIILINEAAKKILKLKTVPENIFSFFEELLDTVFIEKKQIDIKETNIEIDGKIITIENSIAPILIKGKLEGAVIVFRDITEKKKYQQEILKKEKLEAVGMLAAGIAHDFNNILTAALGNISLCELYVNDKSKLIEKLKATEESLFKAKSLTEKLLTFSKGGYLIKETNDIRKIIKESVNFILSGKNIKVEYKFQEDLWPVNVDASQLTQVFHNLTLNSIEAIEKDGKIEISAQNKVISEDSNLPLKPGNYIEIIFKDNGKGIPVNILNKIFDPFFSTKKDGSGLGLSTVYSIIKKHDGYIKVNSVYGKGTIFFIYLPAESNETLLLKKKSSTQKKEISKETTKKRILFMDDNDELREAVKELLELLGHEVFTAKKGEEAIEIYKNNKIDLVILDLTIIGGMGGRDTIKELLKIDKKVKAIVSSGYSDDDVIANYKKYGFVDKIEKPYTLTKLKKLLEKF